ncbi:F-box only protein 30 [Trichinella pseudospiralis]|uniref:F-box only protein 30 n=1 Tax=Trichinella pseudospiralis TaxID=6337 RepID=A0A0V1IHD9_TRIPS|nr:F-box only protein 30 [Trichinella pseudospiralis]
MAQQLSTIQIVNGQALLQTKVQHVLTPGGPVAVAVVPADLGSLLRPLLQQQLQLASSAKNTPLILGVQNAASPSAISLSTSTSSASSKCIVVSGTTGASDSRGSRKRSKARQSSVSRPVANLDGLPEVHGKTYLKIQPKQAEPSAVDAQPLLIQPVQVPHQVQSSKQITIRLGDQEQNEIANLTDQIRKILTSNQQTAADKMNLQFSSVAEVHNVHNVRQAQTQQQPVLQMPIIQGSNQIISQLPISVLGNVISSDVNAGDRQLLQINGTTYLMIKSKPTALCQPAPSIETIPSTGNPVLQPTTSSRLQTLHYQPDRMTEIYDTALASTSSSTLSTERGSRACGHEAKKKSKTATAQDNSRKLKALLRERAMRPDYKTPFKDAKDAFDRLFPYHIWYEEDIPDELLTSIDISYKQTMANLISKKEKQFQRLRNCLVKETAKLNQSEEDVFMQMLFVRSETEILKDLKAVQAQQEQLDAAQQRLSIHEDDGLNMSKGETLMPWLDEPTDMESSTLDNDRHRQQSSCSTPSPLPYLHDCRGGFPFPVTAWTSDSSTVRKVEESMVKASEPKQMPLSPFSSCRDEVPPCLEPASKMPALEEPQSTRMVSQPSMTNNKESLKIVIKLAKSAIVESPTHSLSSPSASLSPSSSSSLPSSPPLQPAPLFPADRGVVPMPGGQQRIDQSPMRIPPLKLRLTDLHAIAACKSSTDNSDDASPPWSSDDSEEEAKFDLREEQQTESSVVLLPMKKEKMAYKKPENYDNDDYDFEDDDATGYGDSFHWITDEDSTSGSADVGDDEQHLTKEETTSEFGEESGGLQFSCELGNLSPSCQKVRLKLVSTKPRTVTCCNGFDRTNSTDLKRPKTLKKRRAFFCSTISSPFTFQCLLHFVFLFIACTHSTFRICFSILMTMSRFMVCIIIIIIIAIICSNSFRCCFLDVQILRRCRRMMEMIADVHNEHCIRCFSKKCKFSNCPMLSCPNRCCFTMHGCKLVDHLCICQEQEINCLNASIGCPFRLKRKQLSKHLADQCPACVVHCSAGWNRWPVDEISLTRLKSGSSPAKASLLSSLLLSDNSLAKQSVSLDVSLTLADEQKALTSSFQRQSHSCQPPSNSDDDESNNVWLNRQYPPGLAKSCLSRLKNGLKFYAREIDKKQKIYQNSTNYSNHFDETAVYKRLGVNLRLQMEFLSPYCEHKPNCLFTFTCSKRFHRREFAVHYLNVHCDTMTQLDGWIVRRCPLFYRGCTFSIAGWTPDDQCKIVYDNQFDCIKVKTTSETVDYCGPTFDLLALPYEFLLQLLNHVDSITLNNLAMITRNMRSFLQTMLTKRGIVELVWTRCENSTRWIVKEKKWSFSTAMKPIKWQMNDTSAMLIHLKNCPFNLISEIATKPQPLFGMIEPLISTLSHK